VYHEVEVLLGGVLRDVGVGEFLVGHFVAGARKSTGEETTARRTRR
jgi:hypothetical protein